MDECKPLPSSVSSSIWSSTALRSPALGAAQQGLILVHVSAQRKRFLWDEGGLEGIHGGGGGGFGGFGGGDLGGLGDLGGFWGLGV